MRITVILLVSLVTVIGIFFGPSSSHSLGAHVSPTHSFALASNCIGSRAHSHSAGASVLWQHWPFLAITRHCHSSLDSHFQHHSSAATPSMRPLSTVIHSSFCWLWRPVFIKRPLLQGFHCLPVSLAVVFHSLHSCNVFPVHCSSFACCTAMMSTFLLFFFGTTQSRHLLQVATPSKEFTVHLSLCPLFFFSITQPQHLCFDSILISHSVGRHLSPSKLSH